jgi:hypothetical protein
MAALALLLARLVLTAVLLPRLVRLILLAGLLVGVLVRIIHLNTPQVDQLAHSQRLKMEKVARAGG